MKRWWACLAAVCCFTVRGAAQESPDSVERIRADLQGRVRRPAFVVPSFVDPVQPPRRWGPVTLVPPETNGEIVRLSIPIGSLTMQATRAVADARHRRAERKAEERVRRALAEFQTGHTSDPSEARRSLP